MAANAWVQTKEYSYYAPAVTPSNKVAAFDLVGTLIHSDKGRPYVSSFDDWVWHSEGTPGFLKGLINSGWFVVVLTNHLKPIGEDFKTKINMLFKDIGAEFPVFVGQSHSGEYEEPATGLWKLMLSIYKITPSSQSYFCSGKAGLHSNNVDYRKDETGWLFSQAIGLTFYDPDQILPAQSQTKVSEGQQLAILVGQQGSGKADFSQMLQDKHGYVIVKRKKGYASEITNLLKSGKSVVFNATNPQKSDRAELIQLGKSMGVPTTIYWLSRVGYGHNKVRADPVPEIALRIFSSKLERPTPDEGAPVVRVN